MTLEVSRNKGPGFVDKVGDHQSASGMSRKPKRSTHRPGTVNITPAENGFIVMCSYHYEGSDMTSWPEPQQLIADDLDKVFEIVARHYRR